MSKQASIKIDSVGVADILQRFQLTVPLNQRPYAWEVEDVEKLFQDLLKAFDKQPLYFMGTVMFTHGAKGKIEVADGQQRLATICILIAAIRDHLIELGDQQGANQYQTDFLIKYDPPSGSYKARLSLNAQDDQYFHQSILLPPSERGKLPSKPYSSNERIEAAAAAAKQQVINITAGLPLRDKTTRLYEWVEYLRETALVIVVNVPSNVGNSFRMFETLNARGVQATKVDILKNFLFDKAPDYTDRIHSHWISMISVIEAHGSDDLVLTYLRHLWISQYGPATVDELGAKFEGVITNERRALDFVSLLDSAAADYVALLAPLQSTKLEGLSTTARKAVDLISNEFGGEQIRPLMLSVIRRFEKSEIEKAFKLFLSWSVRFLIVGGGGGGKLDRYYGTRAFEVTEGKIVNAKQLAESMEGIVPRDRQFQEEFSKASVKRSNLARYYLRAIEIHRGEDPDPQFLINEDPNAVNLEHVLPITPSAAWEIDKDTASAYYRRIGNMALLKSKINVEAGNAGFDDKKPILAASKISITSEIALYEEWGPDQIKDRQASLAADVPKIWPLKWK